MIPMILHKWLKVPYMLHVRSFRRVKKSRTTLLLLHGLGDSGAMWSNVSTSLPEDTSLVIVDLLGSGHSPRPSWGKYDAHEQARALFWTYTLLRLRSKVVVVGHSLGALVAIDFARHYPWLVRSLILCSPPIYKRPLNKRLPKHPDDILRLLYSQASKDPDRLIAIYTLARKLGVSDKEQTLNEENIETFVTTLRESIINQETIDDIPKIKKPIHILCGVFDPFVVRSTLVKLAKSQPNIRYSEVAAAHTIRGPYIKKLIATISETIV